MTELTSFDGTESCQGEFIAPARCSDLAAILSNGGMPAIPRGAGLSYCAASAGDRVRSVGSLRLNRILAFDEATGLIDVEPGIRLGDLYRFTVAHGWILPVMPGHPSITVGGCIACNVHGKNQHREGNFINVVEELTLFHPDFGEVRCSRSTERAVFELTVGGFGLTGFISAARLRMQRLQGSGMRMRRVPVSGLVDAVETMERCADDADVLYSWNDLNLRGADFGRGFVYMGKSEALPVDERVVFHPLEADARRTLPINLYTAGMTPLLLRAYRRSQTHLPAETVVSMARAVFPPNGKEFYFHLFGRKGFREYQCLIPRPRWNEVVEVLRRVIGKAGVPVTLGSLKIFSGHPEFLRFDGPGVVLTLDVPNSDGALALFDALDNLTISCDGLVNVAKDGRVTAAVARRVMPGYERFKSALSAFDRRRRFDSSLRRRLEL